MTASPPTLSSRRRCSHPPSQALTPRRRRRQQQFRRAEHASRTPMLDQPGCKHHGGGASSLWHSPAHCSPAGPHHIVHICACVWHVAHSIQKGQGHPSRHVCCPESVGRMHACGLDSHGLATKCRGSSAPGLECFGPQTSPLCHFSCKRAGTRWDPWSPACSIKATCAPNWLPLPHCT